ncbi:hypothetical protein SAMN04487783_1101 [Agrococcus baldri]|uniref:TIGR03086 family protein n=1 Tax=Agrococcus baldri TaxID=153730 RepID=A0AA94HLV3_9MICO|nr:hypothetical protein [Agrococcus baldri]SFS08451.1 hypothetical protein SAMN04487783_1101 [Agrococcus baldri]
MGHARDRYLQALDLFSAEARASADRLGLPSACDEWSIADVIRHTTGVQGEYGGSALLGRALGANDVTADHASITAPSTDWDSVTVWEQLATQLRGAAHEAGEDSFRALPLATLDMALHAWDIRWGAVRVGLAANLEFPAQLLEWMEDYRDRADESAIRRPGIFGDPVEPPADATRSERFAAWTGRHPRVSFVPLRDHPATPSSASAASAAGATEAAAG